VERAEALESLRGRHIVMVGDSVGPISTGFVVLAATYLTSCYMPILNVGQTMRYEYLNLAKWVETGSWLGPEPHPEAEVEFENWTYFYQVCINT
jgi:hypothetical protein